MVVKPLLRIIDPDFSDQYLSALRGEREHKSFHTLCSENMASVAVALLNKVFMFFKDDFFGSIKR